MITEKSANTRLRVQVRYKEEGDTEEGARRVWLRLFCNMELFENSSSRVRDQAGRDCAKGTARNRHGSPTRPPRFKQ